MAEASWPDPADGRVVDDRQYEILAARFTEDGLDAGVNDPPPVYANGSAMKVFVRGNLFGSVRGHGWTSGDTDVPLDIAANASGAARTDRVVLRLDRSDWTVRAAVRQGAPGAGVPPALVRQGGDVGVFEVHLGEVVVPNGAATITAGNVVARPMMIGSRIRAQHSTARNPAVRVGEVAYDYDIAAWVGWNGTAWVPIYEDAEVTLTLTGSTAGPDAGGWTPNNISRVRLHNRHVHVRLAIRRTTQFGLGLDDADGSRPFILPPLFRPQVIEPGFGYHSRSPVAVQAEPDGIVRVYPLETAVPAGRTIFASINYFIG